jgi:hypothetical protein
MMNANTAFCTFDNQSNYTVAAVNLNLLPATRFMTMDSDSSFVVAKITQGT